MHETGYSALPLLDRPLDEPAAFRPETLVAAVREQRGISEGDSPPPIGILEFDAI